MIMSRIEPTILGTIMAANIDPSLPLSLTIIAKDVLTEVFVDIIVVFDAYEEALVVLMRYVELFKFSNVAIRVDRVMRPEFVVFTLSVVAFVLSEFRIVDVLTSEEFWPDTKQIDKSFINTKKSRLTVRHFILGILFSNIINDIVAFHFSLFFCSIYKFLFLCFFCCKVEYKIEILII